MSSLQPILLPDTDTEAASRLLRAVAAYLARFKGQTRTHTESDLRSFLGWCTIRGLDPLTAARPHLELHVRWLQEERRLRPSTVSRRVSVIAGFYRTCVIDGVLDHPPAEHLRRPRVPPESPTLGLTHLQFEAMLARCSGLGKRQRLRPCRDAGAARTAGVRGLWRQHRRPG